MTSTLLKPVEEVGVAAAAPVVKCIYDSGGRYGDNHVG
jgi:hypothetical protein